MHILFVEHGTKKFKCPASVEQIKEYIHTIEFYIATATKVTAATQNNVDEFQPVCTVETKYKRMHTI